MKVRPEAFVFVVTYGRSGSTLLQSLLNGVDGYCIRGENGGVLANLSRAYHALQDAESLSMLRVSASTSPPDHPWFGGERIVPDRVANSLCESFIDNVLCLPVGTRVGGFKEIRYHSLGGYLDRHLHFISRFFPNAKFVFNRRNLEDVARSGWWREHDAQKVIRDLAAADERFERYAATNSGSSIVVNYDHYKNDPTAVEPLYRFLGEEFDRERVAAILNKELTHLKAKEH